MNSSTEKNGVPPQRCREGAQGTGGSLVWLKACRKLSKISSSRQGLQEMQDVAG